MNKITWKKITLLGEIFLLIALILPEPVTKLTFGFYGIVITSVGIFNWFWLDTLRDFINSFKGDEK